MSMSSVASLKDQRGEWHFYDHKALEMALQTFASNVDLNPTALVHGFSIVEWAAYAKLKARIASSMCSMCKENARLRRCVDDRVVSGVNNGVRQDSDSIFENDPWRDARGISDCASKRSSDDGASEDVWAKWQCTRTDTIVANTDRDDSGGTRVPSKEFLPLNSNTNPRKASLGLPLSQAPDRVESSDDTYDHAGDCPSIEHHVPLIASDASSKNALKDIKCDWRAICAGGWRTVHGWFLSHPFTMSCDDYVSARWPQSRGLKDAASHWKRYGGSATLPDRAHYTIIEEGLQEEAKLLRVLFQDAWISNAKGWRI